MKTGNILRIAELLMENYEKHAVISRIDYNNVPCRSEIEDIILKLRDILFPGYFCKEERCTKSVAQKHLKAIYAKLNEQILSAFMLKNGGTKEKIQQKADEKTLLFIQRITDIRDILATDIQAAFEGDPAAGDTNEIIFSYPGIFAIMTHRIAHELYLLKIPFIPRIMSEYAHTLTGIDIHPGAQIGKYFFIDHGTGIVVGETTIIGDFVRLYQGVTLGALSLKAGQKLKGVKRHPTIEDNVIIYAGASILGGETVIGKNAVIGSNVFITSSVASQISVKMKKQELQFIDKTAKTTIKRAK